MPTKSGSSKKKGGFFSKLKSALSPSQSPQSSIKPFRTRTSEDGASLGTVATRTLSRASRFGHHSHREREEERKSRELEERKSRCLAIQNAKRDPPAIQRLLVDCEFCNPPPQFGKYVTIETPSFSAANARDNLAEIEAMIEHGDDMSDEARWNPGVSQWMQQRKHWLRPTKDEQPQHFLDPEITPDRYYTVFDKLVYQTRPLKHPLNLSDVIKILKCGWIAEGVWIGEDVWSSSEDEKTKPEKQPEPLEEDEAPSRFSTPDIPTVRVQFSEKTSGDNSKPTMPPLERVQSLSALRPLRSGQSSVVSMTDSD